MGKVSRVLVFKPGEKTFRGSTRLCICSDSKQDYSSCDDFTDFSVNVLKYDVPFLRACDEEKEDERSDDDDGDEEEYDAWDFFSVVSVVAVAAHKNSQDVIWLIKISESNCISNKCETE